MKNILILGVFLTLINCNMISQDKVKRNEFIELHKHKGSENYEIVEIFPKKTEVVNLFGGNNIKVAVDKLQKKVLVQGFGSDIYGLHMLDLLGTIERKVLVREKVLKEGTMWDSSYYVNWIINGDTTRHKFIDPFSNEKIEKTYKYKINEKDPEKWLEKFKELYAKAQYIYIYMSDYYFKIDNKWYYIAAYKMGKANNIDIKKLYPPKEDQDVRMVELQEMSPKYYIPPNERDTQLIREMDYEESLYKKEKFGLIDVGYSAGWWYLEIYMPLGDVIKIKRFASFRNPDLQLYKIPAAYDGRYDVLFIVQKPENMHVFQVAGMYAIRPKDPEQPQYRYKTTSYARDKNGYEVIDKEKSIETEEYKAWAKKKK